jgi:hypothetical protein
MPPVAWMACMGLHGEEPNFIDFNGLNITLHQPVPERLVRNVTRGYMACATYVDTQVCICMYYHVYCVCVCVCGGVGVCGERCFRVFSCMCLYTYLSIRSTRCKQSDLSQGGAHAGWSGSAWPNVIYCRGHMGGPRTKPW